MIRLCLALALAAGWAAAQLNLTGAYHFVQLSVRAPKQEGEARVKSVAGTMVFDGAGGYRLRGHVGEGDAPAREFDQSGKYEVRAAAATVLLNSPAEPATNIEARFNDGFGVLLGTTRDGDEFTYDLLVAVKAPEKASAALLDGEYAGGYLVLEGGRRAGLATAFLRFVADGQGGAKAVNVVGHAAAIDDVDRAEKLEDTTYTLDDSGEGTLKVAGQSDVLRGDLQLRASADGEWVLGMTVGAGRRDMLIAVRRQRDVATFTLNGQYWFGELHAENDFVFSPDVARFANASGVLQSDAAGRAYLSQRVRAGGRRTHLTTVNRYLVGSNGTAMLGRALAPAVDNLAIGSGGQWFAGATVGAPTDLTLEHGVWVGIRAASPAGGDVVVSPLGIVNSATRLPGAVAPGTLVTINGMNLARAAQTATGDALPTELGGVKVLFNGQAAPLLQVAPDHVDVVVPTISGASALVQVDNNGRSSAAVEVDLAGSSPAVMMESGQARVAFADGTPVSLAKPAKPGDKLIVTATGLGAVEPAPAAAGGKAAATRASRLGDPEFRVLVGTHPAEVSWVGLAPAGAGQYQIHLTVPAEAGSPEAVPLVIATRDAYTDLAEIPVRKP